MRLGSNKAKLVHMRTRACVRNNNTTRSSNRANGIIIVLGIDADALDWPLSDQRPLCKVVTA